MATLIDISVVQGLADALNALMPKAGGQIGALGVGGPAEAELTVHALNEDSDVRIQLRASAEHIMQLGCSTTLTFIDAGAGKGFAVYTDGNLRFLIDAAGVITLGARPTFDGNVPWDGGNLPVTEFIKTLLNDADAAAARATLGVGDGSGDLVGPASATDLAAVRFDSATGKLVQDSVLLIADTTGALSRAGGGGIQIEATGTNDNATAGQKGEYLSSAIATASAITLTTNTTANVTSLVLTPGDWDVSGVVGYQAGATTVTGVHGGITDVSASLPNPDDLDKSRYSVEGASYPFGSAQAVPLAPCRITVATATTKTVYLVARISAGGGTLKAYGKICARRAR